MAAVAKWVESAEGYSLRYRDRCFAVIQEKALGYYQAYRANGNLWGASDDLEKLQTEIQVEGTITPRFSINWLPTFRCQLVCSYCVARALPIHTHGRERRPEEWIDLLNSCPHFHDRLSISGREPTQYAALGEVLRETEWPITIDTNGERNPSEYLSKVDVAERLNAFNLSLHFHPRHERVKPLLSVMDWITERAPEAQRVLTIVISQREMPDEIDLAREIAEAHGFTLSVATFDERYLFHDVPKKPCEKQRIIKCSGGHDAVTLAPDGTCFRCVGHIYERISIGNIFESGWDLLTETPTPCERQVCSMCDLVYKEFADGRVLYGA